MSTRIYIGGLTAKVESKSIEKKFGKYGNVLSVDIKEKKDVDGNPLTKFAYINLAAETSQVLECVSFFNGAMWKGSELKVELAKESFLDRLKREREGVKNGLTEEELGADSHSSRSKEGNQLQNKYNDTRYKDDGYQYLKRDSHRENDSNKEYYGNDINGFLEYKTQQYNDDYIKNTSGFQDNKKQKYNNGYNQDDNGFQNYKAQQNNYNNQNGDDSFEQGEHVHNNEWRSKNKANYFQFGSEIPKPIEMIRYDPTKPNIAIAKLSQLQNSKSEVSEKTGDTTGKGKVEIFGKLAFSEDTVTLNDIISGKSSVAVDIESCGPTISPTGSAIKSTENPVKKVNKKKNISSKESVKSSSGKGKFVAKRNIFFIKPNDPRLIEAVDIKGRYSFMKKLTDTEIQNFESVKSKLCSDVVLPQKNYIKNSNRKRNWTNRLSK